MANEHDLVLEFTGFEETVSTNSDFLSCHSEVFQKLIAANKASSLTVIKIEGTHPQIAQDALNCIATSGKTLCDVANALEIRQFGTRYRIHLLNILCKDFICRNLTNENVAKIHDIASEHGDKIIELYCWFKFDECWRNIFSSSTFYRCSPRTIMRLVSRPVYNDIEEYALWNVVYKWGLLKVLPNGDFTYQKESHRKAIQDFLPHIRFLAMKEGELNNVFRSEILTPEEVNAIQRAFCTLNSGLLPAGFSVELAQRRRMFKSDYISHISSFYCPKHSLFRWLKAGDTFYSEFRVQNDCFLLGSLLPIRPYEQPVCGFIEIHKLNRLDVNKPSCIMKDIRSMGNVMIVRPAIFLEQNSTVCMNLVITEDNVSCTIEPYACCNIGSVQKDICEQADEWKSFYLKDLLIYF